MKQKTLSELNSMPQYEPLEKSVEWKNEGEEERVKQEGQKLKTLTEKETKLKANLADLNAQWDEDSQDI